MYILKDLWFFFRVRKKYWLLPLILSLLISGGLLFITSESAFLRLIYALF